MTSHELAAKLLALPNVEAVFDDSEYGRGEIEHVYVEDWKAVLSDTEPYRPVVTCQTKEDFEAEEARLANHDPMSFYSDWFCSQPRSQAFIRGLETPFTY